MPLRDESEILSNAGALIAKAIERLERDRDALARKPQYAGGAEKAEAARAAAVRVSQALEIPTPEHP